MLNELGFLDANVEPLFKGNHWYGKNSIGLFLLPDGIKQNDKILSEDLVKQYTSTKCDITAELVFNRDHTYQIHYQKDPNDKVKHKTGTWEITAYPYMLLTSSNGSWRFYFEIQQSETADLVSKVSLLTLKPLSTHHVYPNCSFVHGLRG